MALVQGRRMRLPLLLLIPAMLAACASPGALPLAGGLIEPGDEPTETARRYGALSDEKFPVKAINISRIDGRYLRQLVDYETGEQPGTIVIDTESRYLYLVQEQGKALRYGIGVGVEGLELTGDAVVGYKRQWPRWTPTADMIRRSPELYEKWKGGMDGGPTNPLGARAFYLFKDGKDTLFRIHGTAEPRSIGKAVSSGCIRMFNQDVIDLYQRVPAGARVVVLGGQVASAGTAPPQIPDGG